MSIVRVGTTKKYADGWEAIFGNKGRKASSKRAGNTKGKSQKRTAGRKKK